MQTAAGNGVCHIAAQLAVGRTGIHIRTARPISKGIDFGIGINLTQTLRAGVTLTEDESVTAQNVFAIIRIQLEDALRNFRQLFLFCGHMHSLEDAVIAAADSVCLVIGKVSVLRHFRIIYREVSGNAANRGGYIGFVQRSRSFRNDVTHTVTDENFNGNAGILGFFVCQIHQRTGDSVSNLVRMARIDFFKHGVTPFLHGAGAPSGHPAVLIRRIPCCSFLSRSGKSHSGAAPPGSCS